MVRIASEAARKIGRRIAAERAAIGATQQDLSYHSKVDLPSLSQYEHGRAMPNVGTIVRLAQTLGIDPGVLISGLTYADFPQHREPPQTLEGPRWQRSSTA
ncbi:MAG: helix-turn-helix transcriptional regulator [Microbacteriaceae bacterium]|nr:helix-turn-helix transcriptional regulator [Microbacteriaceae bacterium]